MNPKSILTTNAHVSSKAAGEIALKRRRYRQWIWFQWHCGNCFPTTTIDLAKGTVGPKIIFAVLLPCCSFRRWNVDRSPAREFFFRTAFTANLSTSTVSQNCEAGDVSSLSIQSLLRKKRKVNVSHTKKQTYISTSKIIESTFALPNLLFIVVATILIAPATLANSQICWLCFAVSKP